MKIDEAINKCRDLAYGECEPNPYYGMPYFEDKEYEQLAEWLEELKRFKSYKPVDKGFYKAGYTKGIEDFVTKLKEETFNGYETLEDYFEDSIECVSVEDIVMIAEQLKEGGVE